MEPLFEAKASYNGRYQLYNVYRVEPEKYKAQLILNGDGNDTGAPRELTIFKNNHAWHTVEENYNELGSTIGIEIDVFNNGYGELLGRIGVR